MSKAKKSEDKRHQRVSAGIVSEAQYFARRCGLCTEEAVALMVADHGFYEGRTVAIEMSGRGRKAVKKSRRTGKGADTE
jgi:hypothetical protein